MSNPSLKRFIPTKTSNSPKRKLRIIVEQQMAVVDEIETLDLKED